MPEVLGNASVDLMVIEYGLADAGPMGVTSLKENGTLEAPATIVWN
jgi:hypothetical protein